MSDGALDDEWDSASWGGSPGLDAGTTASASLMNALAEAQAEASALRAALADNGLDLLEARGAAARALAELRVVRSAPVDPAPAPVDMSLPRVLAQSAEVDALRARAEELSLRLAASEDACALARAAALGNHGPCAAAIEDARADASAAHAAARAARTAETTAARDCDALAAALRAADAATASARDAASAATARAVAAEAQLASVISSSATDAARAEAAEESESFTRAELSKRLRQLHAVVDALKVVRQREALAEAALAAQATSLTGIAVGSSKAESEALRWRSAAESAIAECADARRERDALAGELAAARARAKAEADMVASATEAGAAVATLSRALEVVTEDRERCVFYAHGLRDFLCVRMVT